MNYWTLLVVTLVVFTLFLVLKRASLVPEKLALEHLHAKAHVIDVRSPNEFKSCHIPGAINIPLNHFREMLPSRVPDKNQVLLIHCLSGGRSAVARHYARQLGYSNAFNLGSLSRAQRIVGNAQAH